MLKIDQAKAIFATVNGSSFIGLDTETLVPLKGGRRNPHQGRITKRVVGSNVMVFQNRQSSAYGDMVKRRLAAEGVDPDNFELSPRKWGVRIPNTPFIEHEGKHYLEVIFLRAGEVSYYCDGNPIAKEEIVGLSEPTVNPESQGGLEKKVILRTYSLESVVGLRVNGLNIVIN